MIRHRQRVHYEGSGIPGKVLSTQDASGQQLLQYSAGPLRAEMQSVMHKLGSLTPCPALAYQSVPWIVAVTHRTSSIGMRWHARCALSTMTEWNVTFHGGMLHGRACTILGAGCRQHNRRYRAPCVDLCSCERETTSPHDNNHLIAAQNLQCRPWQLNVQTPAQNLRCRPRQRMPPACTNWPLCRSDKATGRNITLRQRWASLGTY